MSILHGTNSSDESRSDSISDDFEFVEETDSLPIRTKNSPSSTPIGLEIHPLHSEDSVLVTINPPKQPTTNIKHVPCDVVLVIDVSGSMSWAAPLPDAQDKENQESSGLSILDLTKHAARTILETLDEGDRLGLVTFSQDAKIVQPLTVMTTEAKKETATRIKSLVDESATNLWAGIRTGLKLFDDTPFNGHVQGLFVLTDGMPNHMCPPQGYVTKLKPMLSEMASKRPCIPAIHTFGFGYSIRSDLMQAIAEVGNGNYAFIPDAGMIGTVFVHAVANLYCTYATAAELVLKSSDEGTTFKYTAGIPSGSSRPDSLTIRMGNIQYGQSKDMVIPYSKTGRNATLTAKLSYKLPNGATKVCSNTIVLSKTPKLQNSTASYHVHRNQLCTFLASHCTPCDSSAAVPLLPLPTDIQAQIEQLSKSIKSSLAKYPNDPDIASLLHDLIGPDNSNNTGQISQAFIDNPKARYYGRWGIHYLPSLLHAHMRQTCNSFKDPGPLRYGAQSPLFIRCRDELDAAFDNLPAPEPTLPVNSKAYRHGQIGGHIGKHGASRSPISMSSYNRYDNVCFLGSCRLTLPHGRTMRVDDLTPGTQIWSPLIKQERTVVAIVETKTARAGQMVYRVGRHGSGGDDGLWITAYHPILRDGTWVFPHNVADDIRPLASHEAVYSIFLEPSDGGDVDSHAVEVEGVSCVTLGHGLITSPSTISPVMMIQEAVQDIRAHPFFGHYEAVRESLARLSTNEKGHLMCAGVVRSSTTKGDGLVCGFLPATTTTTSRPEKKSGIPKVCVQEVDAVGLVQKPFFVVT